MKILFVAGFGPIVKDSTESNKFYKDVLGLELKERGGYEYTDDLPGVKHFSLWPLSHAAEECFGGSTWPENMTVPQAWLEIDVDSVEEATKELMEKGYKVLVVAEKKPWGQTVSRLLSPEGILFSVTYTPWMREGDGKERISE